MTTLIIDIGSSSARVLLFNTQGELIPHTIARRSYHFDEHATLSPTELLDCVERCIDEVLTHPQAQYIRAVGMTTFVGNLMGLDAGAKPITPLYTYADTRSSHHATQLAQHISMSDTHTRTGCRIHPAYHPAKLAWLQSTQPELVARVAHWLDFASYSYGVWFGKRVPCSYSVASWSGLLNKETLAWDSTWLQTLNLQDDMLPPLADYHATQQGLAHPYATRWQALRDVPFYLAVGDGAVANIGSGGTQPHLPVLTVGTTSALRIITPAQHNTHIGLWSYRVDAKRHLIGGATNEGGNIFAWAKSVLQLPSDVEEALRDYAPTHKPLALPLFAGERSPHYNAHATGTLHGLHLHTTALGILYALLEGVAIRLRLVLDAIGQDSAYILAGGGALHASSAWTQLFADVLERPIYRVTEAEAAAKGLFLLIHEHLSPTYELPQIQYDQQFYPRHIINYAPIIQEHQALYRTLYSDAM